MLDVPIRLAGQAVGVVCHEHVGPARQWTVEEQSFGTAIAGFVTTAMEARERKQAEAAIRESEERFRSVVENSPAGIFIIDDAYRFVYANDELFRMLGCTSEEVLGRNFQEFLSDEAGRWSPIATSAGGGARKFLLNMSSPSSARTARSAG